MRTGTLEDAIELTAKKFRGVTDKAGKPYILHLLRVMLSVESGPAQIAGVLHDLVEDTSVTLEELRQLGFASEIIDAIDCLTHRACESYAAYVLRIKLNSLAVQCKLADLNDNYRLDRVVYRDGNAEKDAVRLQKYILSYQFLNERIDRVTYLRLMQPLE